MTEWTPGLVSKVDLTDDAPNNTGKKIALPLPFLPEDSLERIVEDLRQTTREIMKCEALLLTEVHEEVRAHMKRVE